MYRLYASAGRCIRSRSDTTESLDEPKKLGIPTAMSLQLFHNAQRVLVQPRDKEDKEEGDEPAEQREGIGNRYQDLAQRPDVSPCRVLFFVSGRNFSGLIGPVISARYRDRMCGRRGGHAPVGIGFPDLALEEFLHPVRNQREG